MTSRPRQFDHDPGEVAQAATRPGPSGTEARVCEDIAARQRLGIQKYGQTVAANPLGHRAWLWHAYEESLDHSVYLRRAIEQLDADAAAAAARAGTTTMPDQPPVFPT